ncbi:Hypothetical_protein [Hexamita inflata]|uniref:Hypothetical_protein n=1 Tax=Hexamita inflata TaxID=28002 RepID=A0AA86NGL6_9EUKA|nr:Hypothetical protein HINF_LOCUS6598 [Hexamita inflata]
MRTITREVSHAKLFLVRVCVKKPPLFVVEVAYEGPSPSNIVLGPTHNSYLQQRLAFIIEAAKFNLVKAQLFFVQLSKVKIYCFMYLYLQLAVLATASDTISKLLIHLKLNKFTFTAKINFWKNTIVWELYRSEPE